MSGNGGIDWEELARVMWEEREDKLYALMCVKWPDRPGLECLNATSYYRHVMDHAKSNGLAGVPVYMLDGLTLMLDPGKFEGLKAEIRKLDASRGWT